MKEYPRVRLDADLAARIHAFAPLNPKAARIWVNSVLRQAVAKREDERLRTITITAAEPYAKWLRLFGSTIATGMPAAANIGDAITFATIPEANRFRDQLRRIAGHIHHVEVHGWANGERFCRSVSIGRYEALENERIDRVVAVYDDGDRAEAQGFDIDLPIYLAGRPKPGSISYIIGWALGSSNKGDSLTFTAESFL